MSGRLRFGLIAGVVAIAAALTALVISSNEDEPRSEPRQAVPTTGLRVANPAGAASSDPFPQERLAIQDVVDHINEELRRNQPQSP